MIVHYMPWLMSCITILHSWMVGNKDRRGWAIALVNQFLWLTWIILSGTWGFLILNLFLWYVYTRNYIKWSRT